jgi:hypothetical protein
MPQMMIMINGLCDIESLMNELSMSENGWMLKEITDRESICFQIEFILVSIEKLHEKERVTTNAEDVCVS